MGWITKNGRRIYVDSDKKLEKEMNRDRDKYDIVRFYREGDPTHKIIRRGLTKEQAEAHTGDPKTRKAGVYFDGFAKEGYYK